MRQQRTLMERLRDPVLLLGTAISAGLGVLFYGRPDPKTAFGVFAALLGITITLQIQAILMAQRGIAAESQKNRLTAALERIPWLLPSIETIPRTIATVQDKFGTSAAPALCKQAVQDCIDQLSRLETGHYQPDYGDLRLFNFLTSAATKTIRATSAQGLDLAWWFSTKSEQYWRLQIAAMGRGVEIKRIFIYSSWTAKLASLVHAQSQARIKVWTLPASALPRHLITDMVVWDESCGYETRSNATGEPVVNFFTLVPHEIEKMKLDFDGLLEVATPYSHKSATP